MCIYIYIYIYLRSLREVESAFTDVGREMSKCQIKLHLSSVITITISTTVATIITFTIIIKTFLLLLLLLLLSFVVEKGGARVQRPLPRNVKMSDQMT